jgi:prepilin-type N-terminal cleavage/methylation domain-containing protein
LRALANARLSKAGPFIEGAIMKHLRHKQFGFTLVEVAIVLVIIGLLLGGVLKGQSMIENARVKALAAEIRAVFTMNNAYRDLYKATPGDDLEADIHVNGAIKPSTTTSANGAIDSGDWTGLASPDNTKESSLFWQHVRSAGLATGSTSAGLAKNTLGGALGITSGIKRPNSPPGVAGNFYVCSSWIPGRLARSLDMALDDGVGTTGAVFGAQETDGPIDSPTPPVAYDDNFIYTVCMAQ